MKRSQARDQIRIGADIAGDNIYEHLLNQLMDEEIQKYTALRKYPQAFSTGISLSWEDNLASTLFFNFAILPADLQHLDVDNIYFNNEAFKSNLSRWSRIYTNTTSGPPIQFRRTTYVNAHTSKRDQVLEITPFSNISYGTNSIIINYWRAITWDDTNDFPITDIQTSVINSVISRIANLQNSKLAQRAEIAAQSHYIASRGINTGDKT